MHVAAWVGKVSSRVCDRVCVCLSVCDVHALRGKRLELPTPNLVNIERMDGVILQGSRGQSSSSHCHLTWCRPCMSVRLPHLFVVLCLISDRRQTTNIRELVFAAHEVQIPLSDTLSFSRPSFLFYKVKKLQLKSYHAIPTFTLTGTVCLAASRPRSRTGESRWALLRIVLLVCNCQNEIAYRSRDDRLCRGL